MRSSGHFSEHPGQTGVLDQSSPALAAAMSTTNRRPLGGPPSSLRLTSAHCQACRYQVRRQVSGAELAPVPAWWRGHRCRSSRPRGLPGITSLGEHLGGTDATPLFLRSEPAAPRTRSSSIRSTGPRRRVRLRRQGDVARVEASRSATRGVSAENAPSSAPAHPTTGPGPPTSRRPSRRHYWECV